MKLALKIVSLFLILFCVSFSLNKNEIEIPKHFPKPVYNLSSQNSSTEKISLGKELFYDPVLSKDSSTSCASCHSPFNAFAHTDHQLSHGIYDLIGTRNAPALFNLAWNKNLMWDGAVNDLKSQVLIPIAHPKEMGETITNLILKLNRSKNYSKKFYSAFKDSIVTEQKLAETIAQFELTLISSNSKYDSVKLGKSKFNLQEKNGYKLFLKHCNTCHKEPLFTNNTFANNGLAIDSSLFDVGRMSITKNKKDSLCFKIPSLRNLSYSFPYMHDGRFKNLNQVINHYVFEIKNSSTLSLELINKINLSSNEKVDVIAFLLTLNDKHFVLNKNLRFIPTNEKK